METKKYRAHDMQEALSQINSELGPDAIIISSKLVRQSNGLRGLFEKKVYEVVAAYEVPVARAPKMPEAKPRIAKPLGAAEPAYRAVPLSQNEVPSTAIRTPGFERYIRHSLADDEQERRREAVETARREFAILHGNGASASQLSEKSVKVELSAVPDSLQLPDVREPQILRDASSVYIREPAPREPAARIIAVSDPPKPIEPAATGAQTPASAPEQEQPAAPSAAVQTAAVQTATMQTAIEPAAARNTLSTVKITLPVSREFDEPHGDERDDAYETHGASARLSGECIEEKIDEIKDMLQKVTDRFEYVRLDLKNGYNPRVEKLVASLIFNGVNVDIAHELARKTQQAVDQIQANPQNMMRKLLKGVLGEPGFIRCERGKRRSVMFIGPTGVGKTTTLAKLAAYYAIKLNMNVGIINSDVFRMAATEQLNAYAQIMNISNITISNSEDIKNALDRFRDKDIVFIDTSGKLASDGAYQRDIRTMIDVGEIDEVFLCMCSTTSDRVCREIINHYRFVDDYKVIVTKIDENVCFGNVVNIARYSAKPLSYLTNGQNVPDDILQIDIDEMVEKVMR